MKKNFEKYRKKENCNYPFKPDKYGYCWSWASSVDIEEQLKDFEKYTKTFEREICKGCEYYNGKNKSKKQEDKI